VRAAACTAPPESFACVIFISLSTTIHGPD
jgi:hypothetical protein